MPVVGYLLQARLRRRWRGLLALALVAGLTTGAVLASASGARRTETAFDRLVVASRAAPLLVSTFEGGGYEPITAIDGVQAMAPLAGYELYPLGLHEPTDVITRASTDGALGHEVDRPNVVAGRMPRSDRADEILVNPAFTATFDLGTGDRLTLVAQDLSDYLLEIPPDAGAATFDVTITGVGVLTTEVVPTDDLDALPGTMVTPAMFEMLEAAGVEPAFDGVAVTLDRGADVSSVMNAIQDSLGAESAFLLDRQTTQATVARAIDPQATALWAFTGVLLLVATLVVGQAVARHTALGATEDGSVTALGVRRHQLVRVAGLEGAIVGALAAVIAVIVVGATSSSFPVGRARLAEPRPGMALNVAVLVVGALGVIVLTTAASAFAAFVAAGSASAHPPRRPSMVAGAAAAAGAGPRLVLGLRRAFETGGGVATVPVRSGLAGAILAVSAVMAAATFAASLNTLVTEPARYGKTWTTAIDAQFAPVPAADLVDRYAGDPAVAGMAGISYGELRIGGVAVPVIGFEPLAGELSLTVLEGREPASVGELALGSRTLDAVGASVGDLVSVSTPEGEERWRVVGRTVFPQLSQGSFNVLGLGTGGVVPAAALPSPTDHEVIEEALAHGDLPDGWVAGDFFIDDRSFNGVLLRASAGNEAQLIQRIADDPAATLGQPRVLQRPAAISTYADVRGTPVVLAVLLAGLAAALVAHVLVTSVRRRRHELATCRALGMRRGDVATVVRWQATALAVVAAVLGAPLGIALGRVAWSVFASGLGVPSTPTIPWAWLMVAIVGTVLIANAAGAVPARRAAQLPPAIALRSE